jgi:ribosome-associated toxin RatA of RatAB toxin-antitoxin module
MNKKAVFGGIGVVVVVGVAFFGYKFVRLRSEAAKWAGPMKEIVEEQVTHDNNVTRARFVSLIDAPLDKVQTAVWDVEHSEQMVENIKLSKLLESKGDTKVMEMNIQALNLPLQNYTMEFTLHPQEHRVSFKTIKSQAQDIEGEYVLEASPDGTKTRLTYTSTARDKIAVPFPQSVLDSANRETYVNTVRGIEKFVKQG